MIAGILLIIGGLLIAFFPYLLSIIVASVMIMIGILTIVIVYDFRRKGADGSTKVIRYIIRH